MVNMTIAIPEGLHRKMREFSDIKWSEVARKAIEQRVRDIEELDRLSSKSKLTSKDVEEFSKKIKSAASRKFLG